MAARLLFVIVMSSSLHEIQVQGSSALLQPKLTVNPAAITQTDSVTLSCQPPSSVSVSQCFFYTVKGGSQKSSCLQTLTAAQLLRITHQTSPAKVEMRCFYTVEKGNVNSSRSDVSYIFIGQKPELSVQHYEADVFFTCSLPGSVKPDTTCNLYFGEASRPVQTSTVRKSTSSKKFSWFCQFSLPVDDILKRLLLVQQKDASCDYSLENELNSLSPRSDPHSLADYVKGVSNSAVTMRTAKSTVSNSSFSTPTASVNLKPVSHRSQNTDTLTTVSTTGLTVSHRLTSAHATSGHTTSGSDIHNPTVNVSPATKTTGNVASGNNNTEISKWKIVAGVAVCGITAGIIMLVLTCLRVKRRTETLSHKRTQGNPTDDFICMNDIDKAGMSPADNGVYSVITSPPGGDCPAGTEKLNRQKPQLEDSDVYHVYCTIPEKPAPSAKQDMVYSLLQTH